MRIYIMNQQLWVGRRAEWGWSTSTERVGRVYSVQGE